MSDDNKTDTPRTDEEAIGIRGHTAYAGYGKSIENVDGYYVTSDFARQLERELNEANKQIAELRKDKERYEELKSRITYAIHSDGMAWATMNWCVEVASLSPETLDQAIDAAKDSNLPPTKS